MAGATAQARAALERRLDHTLRHINADQPRKKRRREDEVKDGAPRHDECLLQLRPQLSLAADSFVGFFANWIRDPLCRRVTASRLPSTRPPPLLETEKRFPRTEEEVFANFETLKSFVGEKSAKKGSKIVLVDGDRIEIAHKSLGDAFEIRKKPDDGSVEDNPARIDGRDPNSGGYTSGSFDRNLREEEVYPPPYPPGLGQFHLTIPTIVRPPSKLSQDLRDRGPPDGESTRVPFTSCHENVEDDDAATTVCVDWRSDATSDVELSFRTESLMEERAAPGRDGGPRYESDRMVERFKRRLKDRGSLSLSSSAREDSSASSKRETNPFCAVPLVVLSRGTTGKETLKRKIAEFAFVEELVAPELRKRSFGGLFGGRGEAPRWNPFLCEGKIVELAMDDRDALSAVGDNHPSSQSKPSEFLVTPRFDLTLEEYLQQTNNSNVDSRLLLFLQSLEAVASLHARGLSHGSLAACNFFVDIHQDGNHRLLLSNFTKMDGLTEERRKSDALQLGRLGLCLFDDGDEDGGVTGQDGGVDAIPVLGGDAPLEMDILVHLLLSKDPKERITPSVAANMLHLYFWRQDLLSVLSETSTAPSNSSSAPSSSSSSSSSAFNSHGYEAAKASALRSFSRRGRGDSAPGDDVDDDVKSDLKQSLFLRTNFDDVLHADEMLKKSRGDLAKYLLTKDEEHLTLFLEADRDKT